MCLLLIAFREVADCPLLLAANREESFARGGTEPVCWEFDTPIVAGRDPRAGGTWLGVNAAGFLVAVTNRHDRPAPPRPRSRGLLCVELLNHKSLERATAAALVAFATEPYAGCNLLLANAEACTVIEHGAETRRREVGPGLYGITNGDFDDPADRRIARVRNSMRGTAKWTDWLARAATACGLHATDDDVAVCLHNAGRGTVSSSLIASHGNFAASVWQHADGPPCRVPYRDYSALLRGLRGPGLRGQRD